MTIDAATLKLRYPAFAAVDDATVTYWLADAGRIVAEGWGTDYEPATFALAAHNMALNRVPGISDGGASQVPTGVTSFRSASVSITMTEAAANRAVSGGYAATPYGAEFSLMLRRNAGGPSLVGYVEPPCGMVWF